MRTIIFLSILLAGCGGSRSSTGDASVDTTADPSDAWHDTIPADGSPDMVTEPVEDPAGDVSGVIEDADGSTNECEENGGTCTPPVAGCTVCPTGSLPYHWFRARCRTSLFDFIPHVA